MKFGLLALVALLPTVSATGQASLIFEYPAPYFWSNDPIQFGYIDKATIPLWFTVQYCHRNHGIAVSHD